MHLVVFEGSRWDKFAPLSLGRPKFAMVCGITTLLEKQIRATSPSRVTLWCRDELAGWVRKYIVPTLKIPTKVNEPLDDEPALLVNGRTLHLSRFNPPPLETVVIEEGGFIRKAHVKRPGLSHRDVLERSANWVKLQNLEQDKPQTRWAHYLWDLISWNEEALVADAIRWRDNAKPHPKGPYHMISPDDVLIADGVKIQPGVVLDASHGPVVIDHKASIGANAVLQGPCYVGEYSSIMPLSLIRPGVTIGAHCKIGGEVGNSIILSYSNKAHHGYLGDSYVGQWVNFGAGTVTSNLKITYGEVSMHIGRRKYETGRRLLGSMIGDYAKTAINMQITTGSYVGCCAMLAGESLSPSVVPSFTFWKGSDGSETFRLDKAIEVARRMFARRDREFTAVDEQVLRYAADVAPAFEQPETH